MKLFNLIFFAVLIFSSPAFSQNNKNGKISYLIANGNEEPITGLLEFNSTQTLFKWLRYDLEENLKDYSSIETDDVNKSFSVKTKGYDAIGAQIFKDYDLKKAIVRQPKQILEPYTYEDNWIEIKWSILNEFKTIEGIKVRKATGIFRGRNYIAWFTETIPYSYGPWKLSGLPGVILEAEDDTKTIGFKIKSICYPCKEETKITVPVEAVNKTLQQHVLQQDNFAIFFTQQMQESMEKSMKESRPELKVKTTTKSIPTEKSIKAQREISFEKMYEWENENTKRVINEEELKKVREDDKAIKYKQTVKG